MARVDTGDWALRLGETSERAEAPEAGGGALREFVTLFLIEADLLF